MNKDQRRNTPWMTPAILRGLENALSHALLDPETADRDELLRARAWVEHAKARREGRQ